MCPKKIIFLLQVSSKLPELFSVHLAVKYAWEGRNYLCTQDNCQFSFPACVIFHHLALPGIRQNFETTASRNINKWKSPATLLRQIHSPPQIFHTSQLIPQPNQQNCLFLPILYRERLSNIFKAQSETESRELETGLLAQNRSGE